MTNEVADTLTALHEGTISIDEAARRFKERHWPRRSQSEGRNSKNLAEIQLTDPDSYLPGSFDDVTLAYNRKIISEEQYEILARAMAESKRAEDELES